MIGKTTIENELKISSTISSKMQNSIDLWSSMYTNDAPWLKEPTDNDPSRITSIGLPSFIASEKARMAVLEFKSQITTPIDDDTETATVESIKAREDSKVSDRAQYLDKQYVKLKRDLRNQLEYGIAKGGFVIKPYVRYHKTPTLEAGGMTVDGDIDKITIEFDYTQADNFYPLSFDSNGNITECAFIQSKIDKEFTYRRLEYHKFENNTVYISNTAYKSKTQELDSNGETILGKEVPLTSISEWAGIEPQVTIHNVDRQLFAYFKMPLANTVDTASPLGVSAYSRAINLIKDADIQYSTLLWEYEGGQMAIDIDRDALRYDDDTYGGRSVMSKLQQRLYRQVDLGTMGDTYQQFAPNLRDDNYIRGLNNILMQIENVTGLSRGTLSEVTTEARTATEMRILKQRSYSANAEIQKALEKTLEDVVYIMDVYCTLYNIVPKGEYEVSFEWDDSILIDADAELEKRVILMQNGLTSKLETRMWYFGETERQAREALDLIDEESKAEMEDNLMKFMDGEQSDGEAKEGTDEGNEEGATNTQQVKTESGTDAMGNMFPPQPRKPKNVGKKK